MRCELFKFPQQGIMYMQICLFSFMYKSTKYTNKSEFFQNDAPLTWAKVRFFSFQKQCTCTFTMAAKKSTKALFTLPTSNWTVGGLTHVLQTSSLTQLAFSASENKHKTFCSCCYRTKSRTKNIKKDYWCQCIQQD